MAERLEDYIRRTWGLPWRWGVIDCTMWPADWCIVHWGFDPAAGFRGTYSDEAGAAALVGDGKLVALIDGEIGQLRRSEARDGDVGVIQIADRQVGAIRHREKWAFRRPNGVGIVRGGALAIWGK